MKTKTCLPIVAALFVLALAAFFVSPALSQTNDGQPPSLGTGKVKVRLYTDYFCSPCRAFEPKAEPAITDLLKRNAVTITFVDAPFHKHSSLYTKYFLYVYKEKKDLPYILKARNLLFEASKEDPKGTVKAITESDKMEEYLTKNGIKFKPFNVKPVFSALEALIAEDKIMETPVCVIINGDKKEVYKGGADILKALQSIK